MRRTVVLIVVVTLMLFGSLLSAATLQMRDGRLIHGKYLGGTADRVNILVGGKVQTYAVSDILLVDFSSNEPAATFPAPPAKTAERPEAPLSPAGTQGTVTLPAGTEIQVRMIDSIDSKTNRVGDKFEASLDQPLEVNGQLIAARGSTVYGRLVQSNQAGDFQGRSQLRLELTGVDIAGRVTPIVTSDYDLAGRSRGRQTAERTGVGAGIGAIIGAIAGGGKGAAVGAAVGGGAGAASQVITRGQDLHIPSETLLDFTLAQPATVELSSSAGK